MKNQQIQRCSKCNELKYYSEFSPSKACKNGIRGTCKECASEYSKNWQTRKKATLRGRMSQLLSAAKSRASRSGIPFDLTEDYLTELWETQNGKCAVSDLPFSQRKSKWFRDPYNPSLDKINPQLGYVEGNIRFVLEAVNAALNEWGLEEVLPILKAVLRKHDHLKKDD